MLVLDTDHLGEFQKGTSEDSKRLREKLEKTEEEIVTTIISVEEIMRGWMAAIHRENNAHRQIRGYERLRQLFSFFAGWEILEWSKTAADELDRLRREKIRIGTMDLKIASIVLSNNAILLSRNKKDFEKVPDLQVEDWLSE